MKKVLIPCILLMLVVVLQLPAFAEHYWNDGMRFTAAYGTASIDGAVGAGEWDDSAAIEMRLNNDPLAASGNINYQGSWEADGRKDSDYKGTYKIMWDNDYIYFLEIRVDDKVNLGGTGAEPWTTDGTLIFTQVPDADAAVNPNGISHHIFYSVGNEGTIGGNLKVRICDMVAGSRETVDIAGGKVASALTSDGYIVEVAVPWSLYKSSIPGFSGVKAGEIMGLSYVVHDNDGDATGYEKQFCYAIDNDMLGSVPGGYDFGGWATIELLEEEIVVEEAAAPAEAAPAEAAPVATAPAATAPVAAAQTSDMTVIMALGTLLTSGAALLISKKRK